MTVVLDASVIIAVMRSEPGADMALAAVNEGYVSAVNFQEILVKGLHLKIDHFETQRLLNRLHLEIVPHTENQARQAAMLWPSTSEYGLSLGDRSCLALALDRKLPVLTSDRAWAQLDIGVDIRLIR
jgi:ribonuclease VapC